MGKVLKFRAGRFGPRATVQVRVLAPFVELELLERTQARLLAGCAAATVLLTLALQLAAR